jgi:uncharacterized membrane protein YdbT with pleckstrin-like domain
MTDAPGWVTLTDGEEVIWQGRPTLYHFMGRTILGLVLVGFGILVWLVVDNVIETGVTVPAAVPGGILGVVIVLLGLTMSAKPLLEWWNVRYLVTSKEVYKKSGVVSRSVTNLNLNQIQNTTFTQSVTGRLLSHGHVHIETAGSRGTEVTFQNVADPEDVVGHITRELDKLHDS